VTEKEQADDAAFEKWWATTYSPAIFDAKDKAVARSAYHGAVRRFAEAQPGKPKTRGEQIAERLVYPSGIDLNFCDASGPTPTECLMVCCPGETRAETYVGIIRRYAAQAIDNALADRDREWRAGLHGPGLPTFFARSTGNTPHDLQADLANAFDAVAHLLPTFDSSRDVEVVTSRAVWPQARLAFLPEGGERPAGNAIGWPLVRDVRPTDSITRGWYAVFKNQLTVVFQ
jgi:hypothetical protein